jgi:hypothetical protein
MWLLIIKCSAASWDIHSKAFKAIAAKYPATPSSSKKMKGRWSTHHGISA